MRDDLIAEALAEGETAARVRVALNSLLPVPGLAATTYVRMFLAGGESIKTGSPIAAFKGTLEQLGTNYKELKKAYANIQVEGEELTVKNATKVKLSIVDKYRPRVARLTAIGVAGGALMVVTTALALSPDLDITARTALGVIGATAALVTTVLVPLAQIVNTYQFNANSAKLSGKVPSISKLLGTSSLISTTAKIGAGVGLALSVAVIWGFFIYGAASSGYTAGSPALNKAFFEAVAATLVAVLLAVLSATVIGSIIVAIIGVIDSILTLICELGVDELRLQGNFYGGACFTITTSATKVLAYFLYNYELMIDTSRSDLMIAGSPNLTLANPTKGYVPANTLTLNLPVTTTVVHKDPDPSNGLLINAYLWLYSPDNLRSSTFKYGLSKGAAVNQAVDLNQMTAAWQDVREDHKYVLTPMYRGVAATNPAPLSGLTLTKGINSSVPFSLTMNFAIPAYECWSLWIPGTPIVIPVCYTRKLENSNTMPFTQLKYDVFPDTLTEFLALGSKPGGGLGQSWDARLPALRDADGDGLANATASGLDPNDTTWDADGDGLSDTFELQRRTSRRPLLPGASGYRWRRP